MNFITVIVLIIFGYLLDFLIKKYVKISMVVITLLLSGLFLMIDISLFMFLFSSEMSGIIPISLYLIVIVVALLPIIFIKEYISHTIRIVDFCINKNNLLTMGNIEKGIIKEIKGYSFNKFRKDGHYLIVDFNGEKIKSLPFKYSFGATIVKTTYIIGKSNDLKKEDILGNAPSIYNVGDEIDVIIYNNKKYVKLKEYESNDF